MDNAALNTIPLWEWICLGFCLVLSGYFSATETALTALPPHKTQKLVRHRRKRDVMLSLWLLYPNRVLTTILIGNNVVNLAAAALVSRAAFEMYGDLGMALATGVLTLFILIFGEIIPKTFAKHHAERMAPTLARLLYLPYVVMYPFTWVLGRFILVMVKKMGGDIKREGPFFTPEDIRDIIRYSAETGGLEEDEREMLGRVFELGETVVREIMVPRTEMVALPASATYNDVKKLVVATGHSRIPVYREQLDNIIGTFYSKDLIKVSETQREKFRVTDFMRDPFFIPETKEADELLREFQKRKKHMALVVDEYGGTAGLVTLEDIIEEIVGEIEDEYDTASDEVISTAPDTFLVKAKINIEDLEEKLSIRLVSTEDEDEEFESLGGFLCAHLGRVPRRGEVIALPDAEIRIEESNPRRVIKVRLIRRERSKRRPSSESGKSLPDNISEFR